MSSETSLALTPVWTPQDFDDTLAAARTADATPCPHYLIYGAFDQRDCEVTGPHEEHIAGGVHWVNEEPAEPEDGEVLCW